MNIWLICQYYKPEPGAPSARLSGFARVWEDAGHSVRILTGLPNHPRGIVYEEHRHRGAFYDDEVDGIRIWRHWLYATPNEGMKNKLFSHLSFAFTLLRNMWGRPLQPDVIMVSSPSFFAAVTGWLLAKRYRVPFVMEVRDLWPGIFVELGVLKQGRLLDTLEKLELFLYRQASAVVTVTKGFAKDIAKRGIDPSKLYVITNGVSDVELEGAAHDTSAEVDSLRTELQLNPLTRVVLYMGNHGVSQALGQVVDAAKILLPRSDILFLMVGDGAEKERIKRIARGLPNIQFIPSQPKERVWLFYKLAHVALVPLKDVKGFETFIPSKMFEIMAAGRPSVGALRGEGADIMSASKSAIVVPPEEPEKMAKAILHLIDHPEQADQMGAAGRAFVTQNYRHTLLGQQYLGIFDKVLKR
ncbi:MAG: glycosyltransferase [Proteobacteria bacterium]|nr:glycosyltransferase [Pseudomonadota bacterium]